MTVAASKRPESIAGWRSIPGIAYIVALLLAALFIAAGTLLLPKGSTLAVFLFDYSDKSFFARVYPFTIQNAMYVMMAVGLADLWVRHAATQREQRYIARKLLPENDTDILQIDDLGAIRRTVSDLNASEEAFLPQLIDLSILQLFTGRSLEQTVEIYTSTLELMSHRLDLAYQTMRFLVWVIPTTGFIGTVVGISIALEGMQDPKNISFEKVTSGLAVAFYTTILALLLSAVLVLLQNVVQRREEMALNRAALYTLRNLINRVYLEHSK
ncbi:MotA/TolQ/ExbB proton channel family protein [Methyloceanibacter sp.]|uniref:MotA/TolQ/ExbB proton channel family protein n=1 Tax=Methyloceanibacter sp. TaxID=1965321 RepID=UPI003D6D920C